ncbi:MAG: nitronate monooxygenase [Thermodesulfobacteriota bacterium]|nr:nitronate monooxygenase [Thermodesulfobacteriota bacterium]
MHNRITCILGVKYPLILGAMRRITLGEMAAAVSNSGGFGQIAASGLSTDQLRAELARALELTSLPVGINIPIYRPNAFDALAIAIEAKLRVITTSAGDPSKLMGAAKEAGLKVLHKVSTVEMAKKAQSAGVDGVIATGFEAGGHVGREMMTTFCLVPQLVDALTIPVVAAGGIGDARGFLAALALGAEGAEVGTAFLATHECPVPGFFKQSVVEAGCGATVLLGKDAMPIRVLNNKAAARIRSSDKATEDQRLTAEGDRAYVMECADAETSVMPCGQVCGLVHEMGGAADVFPDMVRSARSLLEALRGVFDT